MAPCTSCTLFIHLIHKDWEGEQLAVNDQKDGGGGIIFILESAKAGAGPPYLSGFVPFCMLVAVLLITIYTISAISD